MIGAFAFLWVRSLKNLARWRLRRLRQPRYLVASLVGVLYLWMTWARHAFTGQTGADGGPLALAIGQHRDAVELFTSLGLTLTVALAWILPQSGSALRFTLAEVQFLFPAPVSRRTLVWYRLVRSQLVLLLGLLIGSLALGGRALSREGWPLVVGVYLVLMTLNLHFTGITLLRTNLLDNGISALRRSAWALGVAVVLATLAVLGTRGAVAGLRQAAAAGGDAWLTAALALSREGALGVLLAPARILVGPALATDLGTFARAALPVLGLLALNAVWVARSDAAFEEAAAEAASRRALARQQRRVGRTATPAGGSRARRVPFRLDPVGIPALAVVWKNLIATGRLLAPRLVLRFASLVLIPVVIAFQVVDDAAPWRVVAVACAVFAGVLFLLGATFVRSDLRQDLADLEVLKTWPLSGAAIVAAEVAVPALLLSVLHGVVLLVLLAAMGKSGWEPADPALATASIVAILIVAPAFDLTAVLIQNAAVLLFPGWVAIGAARARGVEAMGQRILTVTMSLIALVVVALPAALVGGAIFLLCNAMLGAWGLIPAALAVVAIYAGEAVLGIVVLGRFYDRLDPSQEGLIAE